MAAPKRKRDEQADSSRTKTARRPPSTLLPGPVEQHARILNTSVSATRHFTRGAKRNDTLAARNGVFNTEELLEAVLVELPALDLIRCQRVAKSWRDTISTSVAIKEKLFIKPKSDFENWKLENGKIVATTDTPDLLGGKDYFSKPLSLAVVIVTSSLNPFTPVSQSVATTNVLSSGNIFPTVGPRGHRAFRRCESISVSGDLLPAINQLLHGNEMPLLQHMVLVNLPVTNIEICFGLSAGDQHTARFRIRIKKDGPLTLKDLIEKTKKANGTFVGTHGPNGLPDRRTMATSGFLPFAKVMRQLKDVSGRVPRVVSAEIKVYRVIVASKEDREAVRKGEDILDQVVPIVRRT
ncbi:hypothetical protein HII31_06610 [Pseudocercospora fuligena]|uniref:F-box domain-containing protein n=1 Tax=Pseudocercospora fuligena TaxID=685502 RepID=A0A8H6VHQ7_9PEZI|nr:hypothetical protein HII31_06610 [Pseudocercospora fuligena]